MLRGLWGLMLALAIWLLPAQASAGPRSRWFLEHLALDVAGVTAWRVAWADERNPGFNMIGGGAELHFGLEFDSGVGFLLGTRALFGPSSSVVEGQPFGDVTGQALLLFRVTDWVRVAAGASGGRLWACCGSDAVDPRASAAILGGLLRIGVDFYPRQSNALKAISLWLRIDIDGHPGQSESLLPSTSLSMAGSFGIRI
ncbi:MAG: hypothetical protein JNM40_03415 [Myxococcales bacterium]|nr:hypothetical protein [Myxococcales bacterium]